jgi:serine/threonine-protein kinase RsbW
MPLDGVWGGRSGLGARACALASHAGLLEVQTLADILPVLVAVAAAMADEGYTERDIFGMRLALEEALVNAIKHGHRGDQTRRVRVRYHVSGAEALVHVEDEGPGFDPDRVPDPLAPENLERAGGRGLLLMRAYLTSVRYNDPGNAVTLCQLRSAGG